MGGKNMKDDTELKQNCDVLRRIAGSYPADSIEVLTLKKAAVALQLVFLKGLDTEMDEFLSNKPLTKEQKDNLKRMGIS
jgi:hypothetical protein